jgi:hypothetical protein
MKYKLAEDAKPQVVLLIIATLLTIALWFIPFADYLVYPIRLFVTFIHESSHALVAFLTGGTVVSLTIASDGSGVVYSAASGWLSGLLTSSAGYLGTTVFGVTMLMLIRLSVSPHRVLMASGIFVATVTVLFGILSPIFHVFTLNVGISSILFTVISGTLISAALVALGWFSSYKVANFAVAFLAIQCLLNSLSDLKTVLFVNSPFSGVSIHNDASNMAAATGIPGIFWVFLWIIISVVMISIGIRLYAVVNRPKSVDTVFED